MSKRPLEIGCFRCGEADLPPYAATYRRCEFCGITVGLCLVPCSQLLGWHFVVDAMDWHLVHRHRERHHTEELIDICRVLLPRGHPWRLWGQKLPPAWSAVLG